MSPFVRGAVVSFGRGETRRVDTPTWPDVEAMLRESGNRGGRVDLQSDSEMELTVFAENGAFHVTISVGETDYYFASNGSDAADETDDIFGHSFDRHQVIRDLAAVLEVVKSFWVSGELSASMPWVHEAVDV